MNIEGIRDILRFINDFFSEKNRSLDIKSADFTKSKAGQFYKILIGTDIQSDKEVAKLIYGTEKPDTKFMFLKSTFISRMLNTITHIDLTNPKISEFTKAVFHSYKNLFIISILFRLGRRRAGMSLVKKTLRMAEKYELFHVSIELLEQLRANALLEGKKTEYEKYVKKIERTFVLLNSESRVRTLIDRISIHSSVSTFINKVFVQSAKQAMKAIEAELSIGDTYQNRMAFFRIEYMYYQYAGTPSKSIAACEQAIAYLHTKPHLTPRIRIGEFKLRILENCMLAQNYVNGKKAVAECAIYIPPDSSLWLQYKEQYFLLLMIKLKFVEAKMIYDEVIAHARLRSQLPTLGERWEIYKLYLDYAEHTVNPRKTYFLRQKKYQKRINEYPTYSKDKNGLNVAILVLNILMLIENNKRDQLVEQSDALATYGRSHLQAKQSYQTSILFKLIRIMVNSDYNFEIIEKKARRLERRLANTKPSYYEIKESVLIVPPEWVWDRMKNALKRLTIR
jgi:hypothetical protein